MKVHINTERGRRRLVLVLNGVRAIVTEPLGAATVAAQREVWETVYHHSWARVVEEPSE